MYLIDCCLHSFSIFLFLQLFTFASLIYVQGFRKVDPDRWEFANEGFLRGQRHLLKGISRRKPVHGHSQQQVQSSHGQQISSVGACVEVGKFGLEEEVERLKRDKNVLMQELVRLKQQQQSTDGQLQTMVKRLQGMEQRQQQMMSFLAKAMQSPGFFSQFVQQQNENNRRITETNKKRRLKQDGITENGSSTVPDGQIVKYQPSMNEAANVMLRQIMNGDASSRTESYNNGFDGFTGGNVSSPSAMDSGNSPPRVSGVTLQEVPATSGQSSHPSSASGFSGHDSVAVVSEINSSPDVGAMAGQHESPSISLPKADIILPELSQIPEMVPESMVDGIPGDDYMEPDTGNDCFIPSSLGMNEMMPFDLGIIPPDLEDNLDALLAREFWDDFVQSPIPDDIESSSMDDKATSNDVQPMEKEWEKSEHVDQLTEQMGHLSSEAKKPV
ncbi:Heat shock factor protein HSF8 [Linum perenne]